MWKIMIRNPRIKLSSMILGLSSALDLVNWFVVNHHRQVTSFAMKISAELGFSEEDRGTIAYASSLHDIGAISFNEKFTLQFDADGMTKHAELGYHLLKNFRPFMKAAELIRYHHLPWDNGRGMELNGTHIPHGSHIIHLADRIAVLISSEEFVLNQVTPIRERIQREKNKMFAPEAVDAFMHLSERESFWLEALYPLSSFENSSSTASWNIELDMTLLLHLSELFRMIIDFRSPHTATHSKDVAHLSEAIGILFGLSEQEAGLLHIAGNVHDLGKLAVPVEVLEKNGPLDAKELFIMRSHSFHTYRVLDKIGGIDDINDWASLHHECLDGSGYPFRYTGKELPLGSRIVAVADVLSALTEKRSYRNSLQSRDALKIIWKMGKENKLDRNIVSLVDRHFQDLMGVKATANDEALKEFHTIKGGEEANPEKDRW